jgi:hypothetical protein
MLSTQQNHSALRPSSLLPAECVVRKKTSRAYPRMGSGWNDSGPDDYGCSSVCFRGVVLKKFPLKRNFAWALESSGRNVKTHTHIDLKVKAQTWNCPQNCRHQTSVLNRWVWPVPRSSRLIMEKGNPVADLVDELPKSCSRQQQCLSSIGRWFLWQRWYLRKRACY